MLYTIIYNEENTFNLTVKVILSANLNDLDA